MANVFEPRWDGESDGLRRARVGEQLGTDHLGISVYELEPGQSMVFHYHLQNEELLIVLRGTPTLRGPDGERELKEGEVVHFPRGPEGAHQMLNRSDSVARYVIAAAQGTPEIIEYPDSGKIAAMARTETSAGGPLFTINRLDDAVDYFDGESAG